MNTIKALRAFGGRIRQTLGGVRLGNQVGMDTWGFTGNGYYRTLPGTTHNYSAEVGAAWENSAVWACITRIANSFFEADLVIQEKVLGEWATLDDHPLYSVLKCRNSVMTTRQLWWGALIGRLSGGNGYFHIGKDGAGMPYSLITLPHFLVGIEAPSDGTRWIDSYVYRPVNSTWQYFKPDDIVHFRHGMDITNPRYGISPLIGSLREVCTDNEAATAAAAVLRNSVIFGPMWTPSSWDDSDNLTLEQIQDVRQKIIQAQSGDNRGNFSMINIPGKWEQPTFEATRMAFDAVRKIPAERVCASLGVHPLFVGIGGGIERFTEKNLQEATIQSYQTAIIPLWDSIGAELTEQLLPYYTTDLDNFRVAFDYQKVTALQENVNLLHERNRANFNAGLMSRNEARASIGLGPVKDGDMLLTPTSAYPDGSASTEGARDGTPKENTGKKKQNGLRDGKEGLSEGREGMARDVAPKE